MYLHKKIIFIVLLAISTTVLAQNKLKIYISANIEAARETGADEILISDSNTIHFTDKTLLKYLNFCNLLLVTT